MIVEVETTCPICHATAIILVAESDYLDWKDGKDTYECFPYLSANEREMLITGVCPICWDEMMSSDDDEDIEDFLDDDDDYIEDDDDGDYEEEIYDLDMGFDPYMGCYSDDC